MGSLARDAHQIGELADIKSQPLANMFDLNRVWQCVSRAKRRQLKFFPATHFLNRENNFSAAVTFPDMSLRDRDRYATKASFKVHENFVAQAAFAAFRAG